MGDVNVTQAARDALADYYAIPGVGDYENSVAERVREGLHEDPLLRAFARFERDTNARLSAQTPEPDLAGMMKIEQNQQDFIRMMQQPRADVVEVLKQACALYHDALDMMFDGPDEGDRDYAKARWQEARNKALTALRTQAPASDEVREAMGAALVSVVSAVRDYLPPDGISKDALIDRVIGATDNPRINPVIREIENGGR